MLPVSTAVILAGGLGTRLRSSVPDLPKPMAPINNRPFLEYQMDYWVAQGINHFILSVGYRREVIMDYFAHQYKGARIDYAIEETPLGTGGGVLLALEKLTDAQPYLILNGDTFFEVELEKLYEFHTQNKSCWTFSLFKSQNTARYLGMDIKNGQVVALKSADVSAHEILCNGGVYLVEPSAINAEKYSKTEKISLEDDIFADLLSIHTNVFGCHFSGRFIDIGIPEDYQRAADILV